MNETNTNQTAGTQTPVDGYVQKLLAASKKPDWLSQWRTLPGDDDSLPRYQYIDPDGMSVVLSCLKEGDTHVHYKLRCRKRGKHIMTGGEIASSQQLTSLGILYGRITEHIRQKQQASKLTQEQRDEYMQRAECFTRALLKDARSPNPALRWMPDSFDADPAYRSDGLGKVNSHIWVIQHHAADDQDPSEVYGLKYERDGEVIISCTETCNGASADADLQQLYHLLSLKDENITRPCKTPEIDAFNVDTTFRLFGDRIMANRNQTEGPVLIGDLFRQAGLHCVTHQFVCEAAKRSPGVSTNGPEKIRLQRLAEATINALRYAKRAPNGATFTTRAVPVAYEGNGMASRTVRMTSSAQRISNAYTSWPQEIFEDTHMTPQARINRTCVLLLLAMLKDELP